MTYKEIVDAVIATRFDESDRAKIKRHVNLRYATINAQADWPWRKQSAVTTTAATSGGVATLASSVARVIHVFDEDSNELEWFPPERFAGLSEVLESTAGEADAYTVYSANDGQSSLVLKVNGNDETFTVVYDYRPPLLSGDDDVPLWPEHYHMALVIGAAATEIKLQNDPTWEALELEYTDIIASMKDEVLPPLSPGTRQYGRDMLGYEGDSSWL